MFSAKGRVPLTGIEHPQPAAGSRADVEDSIAAGDTLDRRLYDGGDFRQG